MNAKLFTETKEGIIVHWDLQHETLMGLEAEVGQLVSWLDANEFTANRGFGNGSNTAPARQGAPARAQTAQKPRSGVRQVQKQRDTDVPDECEICGGDFWDNRDDKRNPKAPDFKCKDKNCGAGGWIQDDGSVRWKQ